MIISRRNELVVGSINEIVAIYKYMKQSLMISYQYMIYCDGIIEK